MYKKSNFETEENICEVMEALLEVNKKVILLENSSDNRRRILFKHFKEQLMRGDFKHILERLRVRKNISKLPRDFENTNTNSFPRNNYFSEERIAIYTVLFGSYDRVNDPVLVPDNCDFFLITDQEISFGSKWTKMDISSFDEQIRGYSDVEKNRFFKMMTHLLFPEYKYSIYIDANIIVVGDLTAMVNCIGKTGMALHAHRARNCVYSEAKAAEMINKLTKKQLLAYFEYLNEIQMPHNYGLPECNIIAREHNNKYCMVAMMDWWKEFKYGVVKRDQLYMPIALMKNEISVRDITTLGHDVYSNPLIRIEFHN